MRSALIPLTILGLLACFSLALAAEPPSLELTVKNVGNAKAKITVSRAGMSESKNPITKKADAGGQVTFTREETAHDPTEKFPIGWDVFINAPGIDDCHEVIPLNEGKCEFQSGGCAQVDACDQCCYVLTIKPQ